jgi:hypothetical protein
LWTGVIDDQNTAIDNDFITVLGAPATYLPWGALQPSGGTEDCVLMGDTVAPPYVLYDWPCTGPHVHICECPP